MAEAVQVVLPIVHLNGTGCETLVNQRLSLYHALQNAIEKLRQMAPNGRDYYVQPGLYEQALAQHDRRMAVLGAMLQEIETEIIELDV
jgi:hypothetical protein